MRIISGFLGGRSFDSPKGHRTHPMSDKIRAAVFNILGDINGFTVLDAFAGSGALGLEAISRGAQHVTAIEIDKNAHQTIVNNAKSLGVSEHLKAIRANVSGWSDNNPDQIFDIIFCDPPYDDEQLPTIEKLTRHLRLSDLLVLSWPGDQPAPELGSLEEATRKPYGDAQLVFYRRIS